jgi:hypothetical protein
LLGRSLTGESVAELARDFGVPVDAVRAVVEDPARLAEWEIMAALASLDARQEARPVERR